MARPNKHGGTIHKRTVRFYGGPTVTAAVRVFENRRSLKIGRERSAGFVNDYKREMTKYSIARLRFSKCFRISKAFRSGAQLSWLERLLHREAELPLFAIAYTRQCPVILPDSSSNLVP